MRSSRAFLALIIYFPSASILANSAFMHEDDAGKRIIVCKNSQDDCKPVSPEGKISLYPDLSADGTNLVYVQGDGVSALSVVLQNLKTGEEKTVVPSNGSRLLHPDLSGNSRYLAYSRSSATVGASKKSTTAGAKFGDAEASVMAKVDRLFFPTLPGEGEPATIEVVEFNENFQALNKRVISDQSASLFFPALASDGSFVVFQKDNLDGTRVIVKKDLTKGAEVLLTEGSSLAMAPSLSVDDRYVVYTSKVAGNWDVYRRDLLNGEVLRLTTDGGFDFAPTLDYKGRLVFASYRTGRFELYRLNSEDFGRDDAAIKVTNLSGDVYAPTVSGEEAYIQALAPRMLAPARSSFGAIFDNDRIYVVGGHQGHEHTYPPESFLANLEYFDLKDQAWHVAPARPVTSHGFEVASYNGKLYAFGGFAYSADHKPKWKSLDQIDRFDPEKNTWETIGRMPRARSSFVLAQVGNKAYFFGGWDSTPKRENDYDGVFHRAVDVFDFDTETMTTSDIVLPNPLRRAFTGVVKGDAVYLIGGLGEGANHFQLLDQVTVFNTVTNTWSEAPRLPFATFAPASAFIGDALHVFGGMYKTGPEDYSYVSHIYKLGEAWSHTGRYLRESKGFSRVINTSRTQAAILGGHEYLLDGTDTPVLTMEWFSLPSDLASAL